MKIYYLEPIHPPNIKIMMNKILFPVVVFFFYNLSFSQANAEEPADFKHKITYRLTFQPDSTNPESKKAENMFLYIGDGFSRFSSAGKSIGDSLMLKADKSKKSPGAFARLVAQIPETEFNFAIYKGIPEGKTAFTEKIGKDNFMYIQTKNLFSWEISPETETISGYPVQKATTSFAGRNYTAWFTNEIPISDGPYKFHGLPGLIVKIGDDKNHYIFDLVAFQNLEKPIASNFDEKEFIETEKEKLERLKADVEKDPFGALERSGITLKFQEGDKEQFEKEHRETMKRRNNPLELE